VTEDAGIEYLGGESAETVSPTAIGGAGAMKVKNRCVTRGGLWLCGEAMVVHVTSSSSSSS
jgi:hypothetical protein